MIFKTTLTSLFVFSLLCVPTANKAQLPSGLLFKTFSEKDGLPDNHVKDIIQDRKGFVWIATDKGLCKFDGKDFKIYAKKWSDTNSLPSSLVNDLQIDGNGRIWIGTFAGLCYYNENTDDFVTVGRNVESKIFHVANMTLDKNGFLWLISADRLLKMDPVACKLFPSVLSGQSYFGALQCDSRNRLWTSTKELGLVVYDIGSGLLYTDNVITRPSIPFYSYSELQCLAEEKEGKYWLALDGKGIVLYDLANKKAEFHAMNNSAFLQGTVSCIFQVPSLTGDSLLWLGTNTDGLLQFNKKTRTIERKINYSADNPYSLPGNDIVVSLMAEANILWIGTSKGLCYLNPYLQQFGPTQLLPGNNDQLENVAIRKILQDIKARHILWIINWGDGVWKYNKLTGRVISKLNSQKENKGIFNRNMCVDACYDHSGQLWLLSEAGIELYNMQKNNFEVYDTSFNVGSFPTYQFLEAEPGIFWVAGHTGIKQYQVNNKTATPIRIYMDGLEIAAPECYALAKDRTGEIWAATSKGLLHINGKNFTGKLLLPIMNHLKSGEQANKLWGICVDNDNNIWVTIKEGQVAKYDRQKRAFSFFNEREGLNTTGCKDIFVDKKNCVWVSSANGVFKMDTITKVFAHYTMKDGIIDYDTYMTRWTASDTAIYLAHRKAYTYIDINKNLDVIDLPPRVYITQLYAFNKPLCSSTDSFKTKPLVIHHRQNVINIGFTGIDFLYPDKLRFSYKMQGFDRDWVNAGQIRQATYTNLDPGRYVFRVRVCNVQGNYSREDALLQLYIQPRISQTWWFRSLIVLLILSIIISIFLFRLKQLKKVIALRNKISQDLHDEVGATLSGISLFSDMAAVQLMQKRTEEAYSSVKRIGDSAKEVLADMSDIVWAINPHNDTLGKLLCKLENYAINIARAKNIQVSFVADPAIDHHNLDMRLKKNIYLIAKEAIHNAVKSSQCNQIDVSLKKKHSDFCLRIYDNGRGLDMNMTYEGNGLRNMKARAEEIKAKLVIRSANMQGTTVNLYFKIPHLRYVQKET